MIIPPHRLEEVELGPRERERYARHLILPQVGLDGQRRLAAARVLCIGAGGLGSPVALYLAAAGVGTIGLVDPDHVDRSNLQRQILYGEPDVGRPKLAAARARLEATNPHVDVRLHPHRFSAENAVAIADDYDIVIDGTDNFATRYLSNDVSVLLGKPNVYGSIFRFEGQCAVFAPSLGGPCYRCMFPTPPAPGLVPSCAEGGVLGILPGLVGTMQAAEAIKLILGIGTPLVGRLLHADVLTMRFREFHLRRDPRCAVCGDSPTITRPEEISPACETAAPAAAQGSTMTATDARNDLVSVSDLQRRLAARTQSPPFTLIDVREPGEWEICRIEGARLVPLGELESTLAGLDRETELLVHCKSGGRSSQAASLLRRMGFVRVRDVEGGIDAWAAEIDRDMPRY